MPYQEKNKTRESSTIMEKRVFSDPTIPAFFVASKKSFSITPQPNPSSGQIEFLVSGQNIDSAVQELYQNVRIGALDLIVAIKMMRNSIYALRSREVKHG